MQNVQIFGLKKSQTSRAAERFFKERGIPILYETPAVDLVQDPDSLEIFGVIGEHGGARVAVKARRGVILCCGGHAANRETTLSTNRKKPVSRVSNLNLQRMSRDVLRSSSVCLTVQSNAEHQGALHLTEIGAAGYD